MARKVYDETSIQSIANILRMFTGDTAKKYRVSEMPSGVLTVYTRANNMGYERGKTDGQSIGYQTGYSAGLSDGRAAGHTIGYSEGLAAGESAAREKFWNNYLSANNLQYAFAGRGWTDDTFCPPEPIVLSSSRGNGNYVFRNSGIRYNAYDMVDFSQCTGIVQTFFESDVEELGILDFSGILSGWGGINQTFNRCKNLIYIDCIILPDTPIPNQSGFGGCTSLEFVYFEGTLFGDQNFQDCPLVPESMAIIIECLNDYSGTDEELKYKVTFKEECWEALEAWEEPAPDGGTWRNYAASKGWNT